MGGRTFSEVWIGFFWSREICQVVVVAKLLLATLQATYIQLTRAVARLLSLFYENFVHKA